MVEISQNNNINNNSNNNIVVNDKRIAILDTPGKVPSQEVYSYAKTQQMHRQVEQDVYQSGDLIKAPQKKFPKVLKILGGILGISALVIFRKNIYNAIKGIFKKTPVSP